MPGVNSKDWGSVNNDSVDSCKTLSLYKEKIIRFAEALQGQSSIICNILQLLNNDLSNEAILNNLYGRVSQAIGYLS